jgi:hypothetical protein
MRSVIIKMLLMAGFESVLGKGRLPTFARGGKTIEVMSSAVYINGDLMGAKDFIKRCKNRYSQRRSPRRDEYRARKPKVNDPTVRVGKTRRKNARPSTGKATNVGNPREKGPGGGNGKKGHTSKAKVIKGGGKKKRKLYKSPEQLKHEAYLKSMGKMIGQ